MTLVGGRPGAPTVEAAAWRSRSADSTTVLAVFVALQFLLPSQLVLNYLPFSLSAASLVALCLGTFWFCAQLTTTLGAAKGPNPVRTMLFVYVCVLIASYADAAFGYLSADERRIGDHAMVTVFAMILVALAACDGVRSRERLYFLLRVVVGCSATVAVVGILQFLFNLDLAQMVRPPGMHLTTVAYSVLERGGMPRVAGTTAHPIEFGVLCAMTLPLAIHVAHHASATGRRAWVWWWCTGLIAAGLMFSVSRSAILGVLVASVVLFVGWPARRRAVMALAALGFVAVVKLASPGLLGTFFALFKNAGSDSSIQWRTHDYATARELISAHTLLGRGIGTWYAPKHEIFDNQYLLTLVETGVVGLAAFVGVIVSACYATARVSVLCRGLTTGTDAGHTDRDLAVSLAASFAVVLLICATFDFAVFPTVSALLFLLVGMAGALLRIVRADVEGGPLDPFAMV